MGFMEAVSILPSWITHASSQLCARKMESASAPRFGVSRRSPSLRYAFLLRNARKKEVLQRLLAESNKVKASESESVGGQQSATLVRHPKSCPPGGLDFRPETVLFFRSKLKEASPKLLREEVLPTGNLRSALCWTGHATWKHRGHHRSWTF